MTDLLLLNIVKEQGLVDIINSMLDIDYNDRYYDIEEELIENFNYTFIKYRRMRGDLYRLTFKEKNNGELIFFYVNSNWEYNCGSLGFRNIEYVYKHLKSGNTMSCIWNGYWIIDEVVKKIFKMTMKILKNSYRGDFNKMTINFLNKSVMRKSKTMYNDYGLVFRTNMKTMFKIMKEFESNNYDETENLFDCLNNMEEKFFENGYMKQEDCN